LAGIGRDDPGLCPPMIKILHVAAQQDIKSGSHCGNVKDFV
jgi:hypothetical protein